MNRTLYTLLFHLGLPLVALRLYLRARKAPAYGQRIGERFAFKLPAMRQGVSGYMRYRWARALLPHPWCVPCSRLTRSCRSH